MHTVGFSWLIGVSSQMALVLENPSCEQHSQNKIPLPLSSEATPLFWPPRSPPLKVSAQLGLTHSLLASLHSRRVLSRELLAGQGRKAFGGGEQLGSSCRSDPWSPEQADPPPWEGPAALKGLQGAVLKRSELICTHHLQGGLSAAPGTPWQCHPGRSNKAQPNTTSGKRERNQLPPGQVAPADAFAD